MFDYLVVGAGYAGSIFARCAAEAGYNVLVVEKRSHIAGNAYDFINHDTGLIIHKYGPHFFHTNDEEVFSFLSRFTEWKEEKLKSMVKIGEKTVPLPFNFKGIDTFFENSEEIKSLLIEKFGKRSRVTISQLRNEPLFKELLDFVHENIFKKNTMEQWGVENPIELDLSIIDRTPIELSYNDNFFVDKYQVLPKEGYTKMFENILDHENINIMLQTELFDIYNIIENKLFGNRFNGRVIYTGPLDSLFAYSYGELPYHSLDIAFEEISKSSYQKTHIVAYPNKKYTRVVDYSKINDVNHKKTIISKEYPCAYIPGMNEAFYPKLTKDSSQKFKEYMKEVDLNINLFAIGRLAEFKYYNMDQIVKKSLELAKDILA